MNKTFLAILLIASLVLLCGCTEEESEVEDEDEEKDLSPTKEGAMEFSMEVLQTYFDNDFEGFYSLLSDEVYFMEGEGPFTETEVRGFLEDDEYLMGKDFTAYSMEQYEQTYAPRVLNRTDVNTEFPGVIETMKDLGWDFGDDDLIFLGYETKDGSEGPLWDDPLILGVSYQSSEYVFKDIGPSI